MYIIDRYYKNSKCNVFSFSIYLVVAEHVDMWITSKTARFKNEVQKRKLNRKREPLRPKEKTQQGFLYKHTKAQVRKNKGRRREKEHEESNLLLVDNSVDNMWITFKRIKNFRYHMKKNRAYNRYHISKKVAIAL